MFVCFENKPIVILLLLLFVILIAWFSIGKARSQEFGTNQVGWGWGGGGGRDSRRSVFPFPQVGAGSFGVLCTPLLREPRGGAGMKHHGAERWSLVAAPGKIPLAGSPAPGMALRPGLSGRARHPWGSSGKAVQMGRKGNIKVPSLETQRPKVNKSYLKSCFPSPLKYSPFI